MKLKQLLQIEGLTLLLLSVTFWDLKAEMILLLKLLSFTDRSDGHGGLRAALGGDLGTCGVGQLRLLVLGTIQAFVTHRRQFNRLSGLLAVAWWHGLTSRAGFEPSKSMKNIRQIRI